MTLQRWAALELREENRVPEKRTGYPKKELGRLSETSSGGHNASFLFPYSVTTPWVYPRGVGFLIQAWEMYFFMKTLGFF